MGGGAQVMSVGDPVDPAILATRQRPEKKGGNRMLIRRAIGGISLRWSGLGEGWKAIRELALRLVEQVSVREPGQLISFEYDESLIARLTESWGPELSTWCVEGGNIKGPGWSRRSGKDRASIRFDLSRDLASSLISSHIFQALRARAIGCVTSRTRLLIDG